MILLIKRTLLILWTKPPNQLNILSKNLLKTRHLLHIRCAMFAAKLCTCQALVLALAMMVGLVLAQTTNNFLITVEVDLVFPRNQTYTPDPALPIVFAIQNFQA